jgi:cystine transport system permease protein
VLRVATEGTYSPFSFHAEGTNELTGYDVEVIEAVAESSVARWSSARRSSTRSSPGLESDRYDVIANQITINPEREERYLFSAPVHRLDRCRRDARRRHQRRRLEDVRGKRSAQSTTSSFGELAREAGAQVEAVEGFSQAVTLLKQGRVDVTINDSLAVLEYQKSTGDDDITIAAEIDQPSEQAFVFRKDSAELQAEVDEALARCARTARWPASRRSTSARTSAARDAVSADRLGARPQQPGPLLRGCCSARCPLTALSFVLGLALALLLALMRLSGRALVSAVARAYVSLVRGTPLLLQLFIVFYGLPALGLTIDPYPARSSPSR